MSAFFDFFLGQKKPTASVAKERLQIILAHERTGGSPHQPDYLPALQRDVMAVLTKYMKVDSDDVKVMFERKGNLDVLEVKVEIQPCDPPASVAAAQTLDKSRRQPAPRANRKRR